MIIPEEKIKKIPYNKKHEAEQTAFKFMSVSEGQAPRLPTADEQGPAVFIGNSVYRRVI